MGSSQSKTPAAEAAMAEKLMERIRALEIEETDTGEPEKDFVYVGEGESKFLYCLVTLACD